MSSKRSHTKSRLGCQQCKSRRIKCDETPQCCCNCAKKGLECEYQAAMEKVQFFMPGGGFSSEASSISPPSSVSSGRRRSSPLRPEESPGFNLNDLGLLHHFTLYTSLTIDPINSVEYQQIWQYQVPRVAQDYPFLMHAVLGFSAAHKSSSECSPQEHFSLLQTARQHYSKALVSFRTSVRELNPDQTANALLGYLILICFLTLYLEFDKPEPEKDGIEDLLSLLQVLHGSMGVLVTIRKNLEQSDFGLLLRHAQPHLLRPHPAATEVKLSLGQLESMVISKFGPSDSIAIIDAIAKLMRMYTLTSPEPSDWAHILQWPILLGEGASSNEFLLLLEQRHPAALCVAAHWAVAAYNAPRKWNVADWPQRLLLGVEKQLAGTEWAVCLEWPLRKTRLGSGR